jgi:hypothetical protein
LRHSRSIGPKPDAEFFDECPVECVAMVPFSSGPHSRAITSQVIAAMFSPPHDALAISQLQLKRRTA